MFKNRGEDKVSLEKKCKNKKSKHVESKDKTR